jgi:hypothetical protein
MLGKREGQRDSFANGVSHFHWPDHFCNVTAASVIVGAQHRFRAWCGQLAERDRLTIAPAYATARHSTVSIVATLPNSQR